MTTVLLTGGAGCAGSHIADEIVATTDWNVFVLDALPYAGRLDRLAHLPADRVQVVYHDFREPLSNNVFSLLCTRDIDSTARRRSCAGRWKTPLARSTCFLFHSRTPKPPDPHLAIRFKTTEPERTWSQVLPCPYANNAEHSRIVSDWCTVLIGKPPG